MRNLAHVVAIAALAVCPGCVVVSISPLAADKDAVYEPALVGVWSESSTTRYAISQLGERGYRIDITESGEKSTMTATLFRLDGVLFLDLMPSTTWAEMGVPKAAASMLTDWFVPLHLFVRVNQVAPSLSVSPVGETWLKTFLEKHPSALAHTIRDSNVVLTGSTGEIQKFFREHLNTPGAFEKPTVLARQAP